jgi:hypothetical protein
MAQCEVCGNDYDKSFVAVLRGGRAIEGAGARGLEWPTVVEKRITVELTLKEAEALVQAWLIEEYADFSIEVTEAEVDALKRAQEKLRAAIKEQS